MPPRPDRPTLLGEEDGARIEGPAAEVLDVLHLALSITLLEVVDQLQADRLAYLFVSRGHNALATRGYVVRDVDQD